MGYVTAIMAVYLAGDEGKLGFWPVCLPAINPEYPETCSQPSATPLHGVVNVNEWQRTCAVGLESVWTFLGCCTWEELMKQSGAL